MLELLELFSGAPLELQVMLLGGIVITLWEVLKRQ